MRVEVLSKIVIRFLPIVVVLAGSYLLTGYDLYSVKWFIGIISIIVGTVMLAKNNLGEKSNHDI